MKQVTTRIALATLVLAFSVLAVEAQNAPRTQPKKITRDQLRVAAQQICPVSGQKLGAHGAPVKVAIGKQKEEVFLCCKACLKGQLNPQHWKTIHTNYAKTQGKCPVMGHDLPPNAKWTIADGKIVYVCCPPCTEKIAANKANYLAKLDQLYRKSLQQKR